MVSTPQKNPTAQRYERVIDALIEWSQHRRYDKELLRPLFARIPAANYINADRMFWLGELYGELAAMVRRDPEIGGDARTALVDRIDYLSNEAPIPPQNWRKPDARSQAIADEVKRRNEVGAMEAIDRTGRPLGPHDVIGRRVRKGLTQNPPWVSSLLAKSMVTLQQQVPPAWMPKLEATMKGRGDQINVELAEYGTGAYGTVMPTLDPAVVLKLTSDPSEAKFATEIADTLPTPCVTRYHMAVKLEGAERHGRPVYLLWRESADNVGDVDTIAGDKAEALINAQHQAAQAAYLAAEKGDVGKYGKLVAAWRDACLAMSRMPALEYVATGMVRAWDEKGVFISDVHGGNLGQCMRNGRPEWVITDPGNVVLSREPAEDRSSPRRKNPPPGKPRPACTIDYGPTAEGRRRAHAELKKLPPAEWLKLPSPLGDKRARQPVDWDDDDNPLAWDDLRNCACASTVSKPESELEGFIDTSGLTDNPRVPKRGAVAFFEQHAQPRRWHRRGLPIFARELAIAEYVLEEEHPEAVVEWVPDQDADEPDMWCARIHVDGHTLAALCGIEEPTREYRRVIEAELAFEAWSERVHELAQVLHDRRGRPFNVNPAYDPRIDPVDAARVMRGLVELRHAPVGGVTNVSVADLSTSYRMVPGGPMPYLEYFIARGMVMEDAGEYALTPKALEYQNSGPARWPTLERYEANADNAPIMIRHVLQSAELHRYILSFQEHPEAWYAHWEFPGHLEIGTDASMQLVVTAESRRDTLWPSIDIQVADLARGVAVPDEGVHNRSFPRSPQELVAMLLPLMDKYHP